jgi:hypothetical protein
MLLHSNPEIHRDRAFVPSNGGPAALLLGDLLQFHFFIIHNSSFILFLSMPPAVEASRSLPIRVAALPESDCRGDGSEAALPVIGAPIERLSRLGRLGLADEGDFVKVILFLSDQWAIQHGHGCRCRLPGEWG